MAFGVTMATAMNQQWTAIMMTKDVNTNSSSTNGRGSELRQQLLVGNTEEIVSIKIQGNQ